MKVLFDPDSVEARRFGAETSGHNLSFSTGGGLLFNSGITASRGHAGESVGERAIIALVNNQMPAWTQTLVFGCSLAQHPETGPHAICLR